jgi:di/tricarboxylate transporter
MAEYAFLGVVLAGALYLFWTQRLRNDLTAGLLLLSLVVPWPHPDGEWRAVLTYQEGFSGFGSSAVIMIGAMFVIGGAIVQTGAAEALGLRWLRIAAKREWLLQISILCAATLASMVINDTTVVLILLPLIICVCKENQLSPSRYLLFAAYGSLLGGQWTLIGTRSNIILSDFLRQRGEAGIGFFDFTPIAAPIFIASALFLMLVGRHFLPDKRLVFSSADLKEFLTELAVTGESSVIGATASEILKSHNLKIVALIRGGTRLPLGVKLAVDDRLVVRGTADTIGELVKSADFCVHEEKKLDRSDLASVDLMIVEAIFPQKSSYVGQRLGSIAFDRNYGMTVLGMAHRGQAVQQRMPDTILRAGDSLLFLGSSDDVERLKRNSGILLLDTKSFPAVGMKKAWTVSALLLGVIVFAITGTLEPAITIPLAGAGAVLFGCISLRNAYEAIDWPTIVTLGGMIPFGIALEKTGAAATIANLVVNGLEGHMPVIILGALLLIAIVFTQILENAAVAIIVAPIAFQVAQALELNPKPLMIALGICVSAGFSTPVAHESTILVMGPGQYQFRHYLLVGSALAVFTWIGATLLTPVIWPLN